MSFGLRLACYDPAGAFRGHARGMLVERYARAGEVGRLLVDFSEQAPRGVMFATHQGGQAVGVEVAVEYYDGTDWVEPHNGRYLIGQDSHERVGDPTDTHDLTLLGYGVLLNGAKVWSAPQGETQTDGKRQFLSKTPGQIIGTLITEAQARGALPGITLGFTATHDSAGNPWAAVYNRAYELSHSILGILQNLYDGGAVDYWWEGRELNMVPAGGYSRDLSTGTDPVYLRDQRVAASPERDDWTRLASVAKLIGDEGFTDEKPNPAAVTPFGRQETVILAGGVSDPGTASLMMDRALAEGADVAREITREWSWTDTTRWMPDRDIRLGDWVLADTIVGTRQRVQVADLMTRQGPDGIEAFVTLGTVADDALTRMAKRQVGIEGGAGVGSIGRPTQPPPPDPTNRWPERPTGLTVTVSAWPIPGGYGGMVGASWDAVTTDTDGYALTVDGYVVRGRKVGGAWVDLFRTASLTGQVERADMRPGETWEVAVAAYWTDRTGIWTTSWSGTVPEDDQAPPAPSKPELESPVRQLVVTWDGLDASGNDMPLDVKQVEVELNGATNPEKWKIAYTGGSLRLDPPDITVETVYTVRLRAVDWAGNASAWSAPAFIGITASVAWPATPGSLLASAETYMTPEGAYRGRISASWAEVTTDTNGNPLDISRYSVRVRRTAGFFPVGWFDLGGTSDLSFSGSSELMQVGDTWEVSVAAVSADGHTGPFSAAFPVVIPPDETPPSVPSKPIVTSDNNGLLTVRWDGLAASGGGMEADLDHLLVYLTGITEPWRMDPVSRVLHIEGLTIGTQYEARLSAVDWAEPPNESAKSQPADPVAVTSAITGLQDQVDQIEADYAAADAALQGQIDTIVLSESGGVVTWLGATTPVAPAERPHMAGDIWWDTSAGVQKRYDGSTWVVFQVGNAGVRNDLDAAKITTGYLDAARLKTDSAWVTNQLLIGNTDEAVVDPTWQNAALNADRARAGWTVAPGTVTRTVTGWDSFYFGLRSSWPEARMQLRQGVRYRVEATVRLSASGQAGLVRRDTLNPDVFVSEVVSLAANVDYVLTAEHVWGTNPGTYGVQMSAPGAVLSVSVRPMLSQVLIQDGLITTPKLAAAAVEADKIAAGAVTALKLAADALNFKTAEGLVLTAPTIQSTTTANRGLKLTTTHKRVYDASGNVTLEENYSTGDISLTGAVRSSGVFPRFEVVGGSGLGAGWAGIRWISQAGWTNNPHLATNSTATAAGHTPGGVYWRGGQRHGLTMEPVIQLQSGYMAGGTERFWPRVNLAIEKPDGTWRGYITLADEGEEKSRIGLFCDFFSVLTRDGSLIRVPQPGTTGDMLLYATQGIALQPGNAWLRFLDIPIFSGGMDLCMETDMRVGYRGSLRDIKQQIRDIPLRVRDRTIPTSPDAPMPTRYPILDLQPHTWVPEGSHNGKRVAGYIVDEVQALAAKYPDAPEIEALLQWMPDRRGEDHTIPDDAEWVAAGVADRSVAALLIPPVRDIDRRVARLEAAMELVLARPQP